MTRTALPRSRTAHAPRKDSGETVALFQQVKDHIAAQIQDGTLHGTACRLSMSWWRSSAFRA